MLKQPQEVLLISTCKYAAKARFGQQEADVWQGSTCQYILNKQLYGILSQ